MKIAIPTKNNIVEDHFGHCEYYSVYETDNGKNIISKELFRTQGGCGCKSNIAGILSQMGVKVLLAGNMGQGAINMLNAHHINVIRGCEGQVDELVTSYLSGTLSDKEIVCEHHNCENQ